MSVGKWSHWPPLSNSSYLLAVSPITQTQWIQRSWILLIYSINSTSWNMHQDGKGYTLNLVKEIKYSSWGEYCASFYFAFSLLCLLCGGKKYMMQKFGLNNRWFFFSEAPACPRRICVLCAMLITDLINTASNSLVCLISSA